MSGKLHEILESGQAPAFRSRWPLKGRYVSGLARFPGDKEAYCSTRAEVHEKVKRQGKVVLEDHT